MNNSANTPNFGGKSGKYECPIQLIGEDWVRATKKH